MTRDYHSIYRITAFNIKEITLFFTLPGDLMEKYNFVPKNIYICDKKGISTVQDPAKILTTKG